MTALAPQAVDPATPEAAASPSPAPSPVPAPARKPRVLLLTHRLPYPPDRGDRIRSYNLLKLLAQHTELGVACTSDDPVWLQHHQLLMTMAQRVAIQPISNNWGKLKGAIALATGKPVTPACFYRQGLADSILQWHEQQPFDTVLTFCTGMVQYARLLTHGLGKKYNPDIRHVIDLVDVDSQKWRAYAKSTWSPKRFVFAAEARRLRRVERGDFDRFDAVTVVSENEAKAYREHVGDHPNLVVVRNGVALDYFHPLEDAGESKTITFVGVLNYRPNADGVIWFVKNVLPKLRQRLPGAKFVIVGRHPTPAVMELGRHEGVEVVGSVPDVRQYLSQSAAVIAPLLIARGTQNKVLEAMSCQRAVVCSEQASQGIDAVPGKHLLVAQNPDEWVNHLERLMTEPDYRKGIAGAAREHVEREYSWERALEPMLKLVGV
ncbi:MAG: TIGR03087 family PEP-CTERM/XrtA system glycosyltransferase [Phycisphaera sp.]|nr:TIGR03087 family PEP-CTERM/XrtA system glycosyltransferase [Phycisphaera sp.]